MTVSLRCDCAFFLEKLAIIKCCLWLPESVARHRVAGDDYPAEVVKSRFMKLDSSHVQYVMDCMRDNTTYVRNIKKYLLAALYNAPVTIGNYYSSLVQHDMYGDGQRGRG